MEWTAEFCGGFGKSEKARGVILDFYGLCT